MVRPAMLWVDLTQGVRGSDRATIGLACRVYRPCGSEDLGEMIHSIQPCAFCSEFDYATSFGLAMLRATKHSHSSIPIMMLTEPHSQSLAI